MRQRMHRHRRQVLRIVARKRRGQRLACFRRSIVGLRQVQNREGRLRLPQPCCDQRLREFRRRDIPLRAGGIRIRCQHAQAVALYCAAPRHKERRRVETQPRRGKGSGHHAGERRRRHGRRLHAAHEVPIQQHRVRNRRHKLIGDAQAHRRVFIHLLLPADLREQLRPIPQRYRYRTHRIPHHIPEPAHADEVLGDPIPVRRLGGCIGRPNRGEPLGGQRHGAAVVHIERDGSTGRQRLCQRNHCLLQLAGVIGIACDGVLRERHLLAVQPHGFKVQRRRKLQRDPAERRRGRIPQRHPRVHFHRLLARAQMHIQIPRRDRDRPALCIGHCRRAWLRTGSLLRLRRLPGKQHLALR